MNIYSSALQKKKQKHWEEVSAATHIKVRLYFQLSEQWHFSFDICLPSSPQHCPCSKMIEPRQRSGFYHKLVFHPPWLKCKIPLRSRTARPKKELRTEERGGKRYTNCLSLSRCCKSLCCRNTVCAALLSDGDLLTRKKKKKKKSSPNGYSAAAVQRHHFYDWAPEPPRKSEKNKDRDERVFCIKVRRGRKKKTKSIHPNDQARYIGAEYALLVPLPPAITTPLYQMASQSQMFSVCVIWEPLPRSIIVCAIWDMAFTASCFSQILHALRTCH